MKKTFTLCALLSLLFSSCESATLPDNGNGNNEKNLLITESIIDVTAKGGEFAISYTISQESEGVELTATSTSEWISNITIGDKITFSVAENQSSEQRVGFINISYGADKYTVGVQQRSKEEYGDIKIALSPRKITIPAKGGTGEVLYKIVGAEEEEAKPTISSTTADWLSDFVIDTEKVTFTVAKNNSSEVRKTTLTLSYDSAVADLTIIQEASKEEVVITASSSAVRVGETVTFAVEFAGEDVTAKSTICDYYTNAEISNPVTFSEVGERAVYAMYNGVKSNIASISVFSASAPSFPQDSNPHSFDFKHRMLLIDHTGTDCGYCPYMMQSLKIIEEDPTYNDYFNIAMSHSYNVGDPAYSLRAATISNYYKKTLGIMTGYPTLTFNYQHGVTAGHQISTITTIFNSLKRETANAAIAVAAKLDGDKIIVSASLKSQETDRYKFNILLLEDNIYGNQYGASESWMHIHNNAIRESYADIQYTDITGTEWGYVTAGSTTHKVLEIPISNSRWVKQNCKVLVIIAAKSAEHDNMYEVVNTTMCGLDESKPFEYR